MRRAYVFTMILGMLIADLGAQAAEPVPTIPVGSSYAEVTKALGSPKEKIEEESRRIDWWIYPAGDVIFSNGRVIAASQKLNPNSTTVQMVPAKIKTEDRASAAGPQDKADSPQMRAILNDIKARTEAAATTAPSTGLKNESVADMLKRTQGNAD